MDVAQSLLIWEEVLEDIDRERDEQIEIWHEVMKEIEEEAESEAEIWHEVINDTHTHPGGCFLKRGEGVC